MRLDAIRLARPADDIDLTDLTASVRTSAAYWAEGKPDCLILPLDPEPTQTEALAIRRRLVTVDADDEARLYDLLAQREAIAGDTTPMGGVMRAWLATELSRYGEPREGP